MSVASAHSSSYIRTSGKVPASRSSGVDALLVKAQNLPLFRNSSSKAPPGAQRAVAALLKADAQTTNSITDDILNVVLQFAIGVTASMVAPILANKLSNLGDSVKLYFKSDRQLVEVRISTPGGTCTSMDTDLRQAISELPDEQQPAILSENCLSYFASTDGAEIWTSTSI